MIPTQYSFNPFYLGSLEPCPWPLGFCFPGSLGFDFPVDPQGFRLTFLSVFCSENAVIAN